MPVKKYQVDTDKGSFTVEVEDPNDPPISVERAPKPSWLQGLGQRMAPGKDDTLPFSNTVGPEVKEFMNKPLFHPTGNESVDAVTSPASLLMGFAGAAKPAANLAVRGAAGLGSIVDPEIVGVISPRVAHLIKASQRIVGAMDKGGVPTPPTSPLLDRFRPNTSGYEPPKLAVGANHASPSPLGANVPVGGMVGEGSSAPAATLSPVASHLQPTASTSPIARSFQEGLRPLIETDEIPHGLVPHSFHQTIGDLNQGMRAGQPGPLDELLLRILREGK